MHHVSPRKPKVILLHDNNNHCAAAPTTTADRSFLENLRSATELLEAIASNRELLRGVPADERERLHRAVAELHRRSGRADLADAAAAKRIELWRQWDRKLPGNTFVARQLASSRSQ